MTNNNARDAENAEIFLKVDAPRDGFIYMDPNRINSMFHAFTTKKTYATGLLDLALITTNFVQLKQLITVKKEEGAWSGLQITMMSCVIVSLILQLVCCILIGFLSKQFEFLDDEKREKIIRNNNSLTILVLLVVLLNIFINVFMNL